MHTVDHTLDLLRTHGPTTPGAALHATRFFVAGSGVITLAFEGMTEGLLGLKKRIADGLRAEHPGSTWPKVTLAALEGAAPLSRDEIAALWAATSYADSILAASPPVVEIRDLTAVEALTRSLELTGRKVQLTLGDRLERTIPSDHRRYVDGILEQWRASPSEGYVAMLRKVGHGREHYHRPCRMRTLVSYQEVGFSAVDALRDRLDRVMPGRYHWFDPSARHITIRTLEPVESGSELEAVEFLSEHHLDP
ncbi:MAG: hypothetical protein HKN29_11700 [Rhodothermales bacterium]|nr:hypothetical protein [Rhodothermales bacterium]